jgi:hypothetical protein
VSGDDQYWQYQPPGGVGGMPPAQPPRRRSTVRLWWFLAATFLVAVCITIAFAIRGLSTSATSQPTQTVQPTETQTVQPTRWPAYQEGYDSVINLVARQGPESYQCPSGAYCHFFTRIAHYGPYTVSRWCDESAPYPGANQFPGYSSQLRDFEAGCSAAVYDEAANEK